MELAGKSETCRGSEWPSHNGELIVFLYPKRRQVRRFHPARNRFRNQQPHGRATAPIDSEKSFLRQAGGQLGRFGEAAVAVGLTLARSFLIAGILWTPLTSRDHIMVGADLTRTTRLDTWLHGAALLLFTKVRLCPL